MKKDCLNKSVVRLGVASLFLVLLLVEIIFSVQLKKPTANVSMFYFSYLPIVGCVALALMVVNILFAKCKCKGFAIENVSLGAVGITYLASYVQFLLSGTVSSNPLSFKGIESYGVLFYKIIGTNQSFKPVNATVICLHAVAVCAVFVVAVIMLLKEKQ